MCHGHHKLDVAHAFAAHFLLGDFDTAAVANDTLVTDALVLAAVAFVVLDRSEDALAEQTVAFGLVGAVVNCFGLEHLAGGLLQNFLGGSQAYSNLREPLFDGFVFSESHIWLYLVFGVWILC